MVIFSSRVCSDPGTSRNLTTFSSPPPSPDGDPAPIGCRSSSGIIAGPSPSPSSPSSAAVALAFAASTWVTSTSSFSGPLLELLLLLLLLLKGWLDWRWWQRCARAPEDDDGQHAAACGLPPNDTAGIEERQRKPAGAILPDAE